MTAGVVVVVAVCKFGRINHTHGGGMDCREHKAPQNRVASIEQPFVWRCGAGTVHSLKLLTCASCLDHAFIATAAAASSFGVRDPRDAGASSKQVAPILFTEANDLACSRGQQTN